MPQHTQPSQVWLRHSCEPQQWLVQGKEAGTPGPAKEGTPNPKELEVTAQPGKLHMTC